MRARDEIELLEHSGGYYSHTTCWGWGWGYYYFPYFLHFPFEFKRQRNRLTHYYTNGNIAIDIFDTKTKHPIWHAKASKRLSSKDLNSNLDNADEVAIRLLEDFPSKGCKPIVTEQCRPF